MAKKSKASAYTWNCQIVKVADIVEYDKNPRWITQKARTDLKKSLEKFGLIDKPILNKDLHLIGGHQRLQVLLELGFDEVECYVATTQLSEKDHQELNIRLNQNGGKFDFDILANQFDGIDLLAWGFDEKELVGDFSIAEDEVEEEVKEKTKKKTCPNCGHKFD